MIAAKGSKDDVKFVAAIEKLITKSIPVEEINSSKSNNVENISKAKSQKPSKQDSPQSKSPARSKPQRHNQRDDHVASDVKGFGDELPAFFK